MDRSNGKQHYPLQRSFSKRILQWFPSCLCGQYTRADTISQYAQLGNREIDNKDMGQLPILNPNSGKGTHAREGTGNHSRNWWGIKNPSHLPKTSERSEAKNCTSTSICPRKGCS